MRRAVLASFALGAALSTIGWLVLFAFAFLPPYRSNAEVLKAAAAEIRDLRETVRFCVNTNRAEPGVVRERTVKGFGGKPMQVVEHFPPGVNPDEVPQIDWTKIAPPTPENTTVMLSDGTRATEAELDWLEAAPVAD